MSKLDIRSAIRENGINCEFEGQPGKALLVTAAMLNKFPADADAKYPDVAAGEAIVTYFDSTTDKVRGRVVLPGAKNDLTLVIRDKDGDENRIDIGHLTDFPSAIRAVHDIEDNVGIKQSNALQNVKDYVGLAFKNVLAKPRLAAPENISAALSFELEGSRRNEAVETQLSAEQLDRITTARALRQTIARINPEHDDALAGVANYQSDYRANALVDGLGVRAMEIPPQMRAALRADRGLSEEVFGAITTTSISDLTAKIIDPKEFEFIRQELRPGLVRNGFAAVIENRLKDIFAERMPSYNGMHEIELYTKGGADVMVVKDHVATYVYGWDTDSRKLEIDGKLALTEADVPSEEEIERLRDVLADIRYEVGDDLHFDMFDDEEGADFDQDDVDFSDLFSDPEDDDTPDFNY